MKRLRKTVPKSSSAVSAGNAKFSLPRHLNTTKSTPKAEVRILIRLRDTEVSSRRIDASHRILEIVVLRQRRSDQFLKLFV